MNISFIDIQRQYETYKAEINAQMAAVLKDGCFISGPQVAELESQLASFVGARHAIGCASGTEALQLALMAYGLKPGDEVIVPSFTFIATSEIISLLGARPVFVDVQRDTFHIDVEKIKAAISPRTRAIVAVDIFGQCADYDAIHQLAKMHGLLVVEDAAQSFGAKYKGRMAGGLAEIGCTSFFPAKPLGCYGDGGMIFTNHEKVAEVLRSLRSHGAGSHKYEHVRVGINSRLDTLQAAVLLAKFKHFPDEIGLRNQVAAHYTQNLKGFLETPVVLPENTSVYAQYNIMVNNRDALQNRLREAKIPTAVYYPKPLHLQAAYADLGYRPGSLPVTEHICQSILALPMHPFLTQAEQDFIIAKIRENC